MLKFVLRLLLLHSQPIVHRICVIYAIIHNSFDFFIVNLTNFNTCLSLIAYTRSIWTINIPENNPVGMFGNHTEISPSRESRFFSILSCLYLSILARRKEIKEKNSFSDLSSCVDTRLVLFSPDITVSIFDSPKWIRFYSVGFYLNETEISTAVMILTMSLADQKDSLMSLQCKDNASVCSSVPSSSLYPRKIVYSFNGAHGGRGISLETANFVVEKWCYFLWLHKMTNFKWQMSIELL